MSKLQKLDNRIQLILKNGISKNYRTVFVMIGNKGQDQDVHARYRTDAHQEIVCRFNERFLLSLSSNSRCLVLDDRWRVLSLSKKVLDGINLEKDLPDISFSAERNELQKLKVALTEDGSPFTPLVKLCVTFDQAKSLVQFCTSLSATNSHTIKQHTTSVSSAQTLLGTIGGSSDAHPSTSSVVVVTAGRGRGKSAALGLGLAAAIESGLSNIYVTSPNPENLTTLMQFVVRGLQASGYTEHEDYVVVHSALSDPNTPSCGPVIVRIDVHRQNHRQSLVYFPPPELASLLSSGNRLAPDLVCIDEAAAIPLGLVRLFVTSPRLVFMASTINGYEGTGRSLSLKLINQLRSECKLAKCSAKLQSQRPRPVIPAVEAAKAQNLVSSSQLGKGLRTADTSRVLYEVDLVEAIRYSNGDPVESWLHELLCLDCGELLIRDVDAATSTDIYFPPVDQCQLYYVNRDTLFAYHKSTELFLHRLMALYVASHYKNSPNDLQLLSDAPAHHIFCLLAPYRPESNKVPEILCVLQVCFEGKINKDRVIKSLTRGLRPSGDLIPWTISQHFCSSAFAELSGARVVRIATHPEYQNLGYGTHALKLIHDYFAGKFNAPIQSDSLMDTSFVSTNADNSLKSDSIDDHHNGGSKSKKSKTKKNEQRPEVVEVPQTRPSKRSKVDEQCDEECQAIDSDVDAIEDVLNDNCPSRLSSTDDLDDAPVVESIEKRGPSSLPPLLTRLEQRQAERLDYIGVSFGATPSLLRFWKRSGYAPVYLRQSLNELTGEFSCVMLKQLTCWDSTGSDQLQLHTFFQDFTCRFIKLLPGCFRHMDAAYALELIHNRMAQPTGANDISASEAGSLFSLVDRERLKRYTRSLVDFPIVSDLLPRLADLYFTRRLPSAQLNKTQQVILLGMGLQHKTVERLASEFARLFDPASGKTAKLSSQQQRLGRRVHEEDVSAILAQVGEAKTVSTSLEQSSSNKPRSGPSTGVNTSWTTRIRGLLYVLVRELYRVLDPLFQSNASAQPSTNSDSGTVAQLHFDEPMDDLAIEKDDSDEIDNGQEDDTSSDDDSEIADSVELPDKSTDLTDEELKRRADKVRQLMSEELTSGSSLNIFKVHGTDQEWSRAVMGHGSDLGSLNVQLSSKHNSDKKKKFKKSHTEKSANRKSTKKIKMKSKKQKSRS